jgi:hypothetical protein
VGGAGVTAVGGGGDTAFDSPILVSSQQQTRTVATIHDLIEFVRADQRKWPALRDELFVAAVLPTPERLRAVRALAVASFNAAGLTAT